MVQIIIFLIRTRLGLKKGERFQFANQVSDTNRYYFSSTQLMKEVVSKHGCYELPSNIKLNYILSDKCEIVKCETLSWC